MSLIQCEFGVRVRSLFRKASVVGIVAAAMSLSLPLLDRATAAGGRTDRALRENNAGVEALKQHRLDVAVPRLRAAHALEPDNATIRRNLVGALNARAIDAAEAGRHADAERDHREALQVAPTDAESIRHYAAFLNNRAVEHLAAHRLDQARPYFERTRQYLPRMDDKEAVDRLRINYSNFLTAEADALALEGRAEQARARYAEALAEHDRNAAALSGLADLDYGADEYATALKRYKSALVITTAPEQAKLRSFIEQRMGTLRKEMAIESDFVVIRDRAERFTLTFPRDLPKTTIAGILQALNEAYVQVGRDFEYYPTRPVRVKVYSRAQLDAIQEVPPWVVGLFDGKLRLLTERIGGGRRQRRNSIFHEYTHAVVHQIGGEAVPSWLHEGLAQHEEPDRELTARDVRYIASRVRTKAAASLDELSRPFERTDAGERMPLIYYQSLSLVEFLLERSGWDKMCELLERTGRLDDFDAAFVDTFGTAPGRMEKEWAEWLLRRDASE
jgi:tetratricopeptide (TPR) repeat protein